MKIIFYIALLVSFRLQTHAEDTSAQDSSAEDSQVGDSLSVTKSIIFGAGTVAGFAASYIFQINEYWDDPADWHVMDWQTEYDDALFADKMGHFYFSYALANSFAKATEWTGLDKETSAWVGFGASMLHQTYVEIYDGYSDGRPYLGFSRGDMIANVLGASFSVAQYYEPYLNHFKPKISYYPFTTETHPTVFNDYNHTNHHFYDSRNRFMVLYAIGNEPIYNEYFNCDFGNFLIDYRLSSL